MTIIKFGTDGWRDLMYDHFNLPNVRFVVQAIAEYVRQNQGETKGVVVGYDARFFSDLFAREAAGVLAANGIKVYLSERDLPTPVNAYAVKLHQAFGAIMFTASHNPPEYNGIKFIPEYAGPASLEITKAIEANLTKIIQIGKEPEIVPFTKIDATGLLVSIDPIPEYLKQLRSLINVQAICDSGLKIIVDPMYATGRGLMADLLAKCSVREIHSNKDPLFGGFMPDPQDKFLEELKAEVRAEPNAIGLATDGDADRFGIIDSDGTYLTPNQVIPLLMVHLIKTRGYHGVVGRTVATTHLIDRLGKRYGAEVIETPVGFKYIGELMRTRSVIIGGEESGGLSIQGHIPEKDGLLACALMAEMRAMTKKPLLETLRELYAEVGQLWTRRVDIHLSDQTKEAVLSQCKTRALDQVGSLKVIDKRTIDGFKYILENGAWFLIRPSGTEALIRVYFEANSETELEMLVKQVQGMVDQWSATTFLSN